MKRTRPRRSGVIGFASLLLAVGACAGTSGSDGEVRPEDRGAAPDDVGAGVELPHLPAAPWSGTAIPASAVPTVYLREWRAAENRERCVLLAPATSAKPGTPRRANFSGGWAVAYDLPDMRSAFGVAGTAASVHGHSYDAWPHHIAWSDGSWAGYGPEGGTGPNQLAYLRVQGQECLYNVWSRLGVEHLEELLAALRLVEAG